MSGKIRVAVLFGGKSVEHEISIISGLQALYAFDTDKYEPVAVYITKNGEMYADGLVSEIEAYADIQKLVCSATRVNLVKDNNKFFLVRYPSKMFVKDVLCEVDVAFPVVHGTNVEDGTLQGYLHSIGIPYVGCDVFSSAVCMDKAATKSILREHNIPVLDCICVSSKSFATDSDLLVQSIENKTQYPVIVKPVNLGSSVGIKKARNRDELIAALEYAFEFSDIALAENFVDNLKEINCSVVGDRYEAKTSVCEEPVNTDEILSYADKYLSGGNKTEGSKLSGQKTSGAKHSDSKTGGGMADTKRKLPADISKELEQKVRDYAERSFKALGCSGVTRVDFLYDTKNDNLYVNELNTIPGSLSFYLWEATGLKFENLLDELVSLAFKRERMQQALNFSFDTNILKGIRLERKNK